MALVKTAQYYLARFELNFSTRGTVDGASYTDVNAQLPGAQPPHPHLVRRGRPVPLEHLAPGLGPAGHRRRLWAFVSLVGRHHRPRGRAALPGQAERVPEGAHVHRPQHRSHPRGVRSREVDVKDFDYQETIEPDDRTANRRPSTTSGCGTPGDPAHLPAFQALQTFYKFDDADVDRYAIDGEPTQVTSRPASSTATSSPASRG